MFSSLYTSFSGLVSFSRGLDVVSHNVGNLNTPGFKSSELNFQDAYYSYRLAGGDAENRTTFQIGGGVQTGSTSVRFSQGEIRDTGNNLDAAINGNGFFVLRHDGKMSYTRAGRFEFDNDGFLVDSATKARVAGITSGGTLVDININAVRSSPAQATTEIVFTNNLSTGSTTHQLNNIQVYDSLGATQNLTVIFTNNSSVTAGSWLVEIQDSSGTVLSNGEIRYQGNGSPLSGFNTLSFAYAPTGTDSTTITLNFGNADSFTGSTSFSGGSTSTLSINSQDGYSAGSLTKATFTEDGYLQIEYSNGQKVDHRQLAVAWFDNLQELEQVGGNRFRNENNATPIIGRANADGMGRVDGGKLELSNVDLTEQFTNMIILQRGYQASSQIISITNEMIQQLFELKGGR